MLPPRFWEVFFNILAIIVFFGILLALVSGVVVLTIVNADFRPAGCILLGAAAFAWALDRVSKL